MNKRRSFIKRSLTASAGAFVVIPRIDLPATPKPNEMENKQIASIEPLGFQWKATDPFLFCVHHEDHFPAGNDKLGPDPSLLRGRQIGQDFTVKDGWRMYHGHKVPGFPSHPHRGFETVTVVRTGFVDHSDSLGAAGRYGNGDVQWMTAGKGIQHAEMFPLVHAEKDNPLELFQIWLNLPRESKFVEPYYKMLWAEEVPDHINTDANGKQTHIEVIAGQAGSDKAPSPPPDSWAAREINQVAIWNIRMDENAAFTLPAVPEGVRRTLYFYRGKGLKVAGTAIANYHAVSMAGSGPVELKCQDSACHILLLQGKPIGEPVVQYGPFVMNSRQEIQEAFDDFRHTQFGGWPWAEDDPVHDRKKGRFALYADGTTETP